MVDQSILDAVFSVPLTLNGNYAVLTTESEHAQQSQTNDVFTEKWDKYSTSKETEDLYQFQRDWYLKLYGFETEDNFAAFLKDKDVILDAGCGLGYKAAWFAELAPHALVVGIDFSDAAKIAAREYAQMDNLIFIKGDIANTPFKDGAVTYVSCDQVIMHTEDPDATFTELARICTPGHGEFACYFYAKKALPRELLDDHFRIACKDISSEDMWAMSEQLTELGKRLSALNVDIEVPDIPQMGIKGGTYDIQRFIYWNFIKCFWNEDLGQETSVSTNFDWYSPSNARRFSESEVRNIVSTNKMDVQFFHSEEACYSGRFVHQN